MASQTDIELYQNSDQTVRIDVTNPETDPPGEFLDLTGLEVDFYIKRASGVSDTDPTTVKYSTSNSKIAVSIPPNGTVAARATVTIAAASIPNSFGGFWKCDIVGATKVPCGFGNCNIRPM